MERAERRFASAPRHDCCVQSRAWLPLGPALLSSRSMHLVRGTVREQREGSISAKGAGESKTRVQRQLFQALWPEMALAAAPLRHAGGSQRD